MISTVDVVITGSAGLVFAEAVTALQHRQRVLVVVRSGDIAETKRVCRRLRKVATAQSRCLLVMTNAEVVCVDGIDSVEAVVIRYVKTGRLRAVNASAFVACSDE